MEYDIGQAFEAIEDELIASMSRNLNRHLQTERDEGLNYAMWQSEQLAALHNYRQNNKKRFSGYFAEINDKLSELLEKAGESGKAEQEAAVLRAIKDGYRVSRRAKGVNAQFFRINERKLNALIDAVRHDMEKAEAAMLRRADDEYRRIIYNSQVYYNTGIGTLPRCVDMATKDFLSRGITCIEYANGARVGIDTYARMALRTASTRAYLLGESAKRDEWGVNTVVVHKRGVACPMCLKWTSKVYYDDVWGNVLLPPKKERKYPLLSTAMAGGLYHPNCKDIHTTYFEGISTPPTPLTEEEIQEANRVYSLEQQQRYNERQIRKYKRLSQGSTDPDNIAKYKTKLSEWQKRNATLIKDNSDVLKRRYDREKVFPAPPIQNPESSPANTPKTPQKVLQNAENGGIIKMGNVEVRKWYKHNVSLITEHIPAELPIEERAKLAFEERNKIRTKARDMMIDQKMRRSLDNERPNLTFEELINSKMVRKGLSRDEAIKDIFETATKTNENVDKELGLGGD